MIRVLDSAGSTLVEWGRQQQQHVYDCNLFLIDKNTYLNTTSDMIETHNEEAKDIIGSISSNNRLHISKLFPVNASLGTFCALLKLYKLSHFISIFYIYERGMSSPEK